MTDQLAPLFSPEAPGNDPAINTPRRYYLLRSQQANDFNSPEYAGVYKAKQQSAVGVLLPQDFPLGLYGSPLRKKLVDAGYTCVEDVNGANIAELTRRTSLKQFEAHAVIAAVAAIISKRISTMGYNRQNNPPVPLQYANTLDLGEQGQNAPLLPNSTLIASGTSTAFETGDRSSARLTMAVTATSGTATPTMAVTLQTSHDGITWLDCGSFTNFTAISSQHVLFAPIDRFIRLSWTITGTTPSFTCSCVGEAV